MKAWVSFLPDHPDIQHDLEHTHQPITSVGLMAEALDRRRGRGLPPFTVMSCDNLQRNDHVIGKVLLAYTGLGNSALQQWIADHVAFPNSMVDRITYVHEIMADPLFRSFLESFTNEVTLIVPHISGVSVDEYKRLLLERFSNPTINDQVTRICSEGFAKMSKMALAFNSGTTQQRRPYRPAHVGGGELALLLQPGHGRARRGFGHR